MSINTNLSVETIQRYIDIKFNELKDDITSSFNSFKTSSDNNSNELLSGQFNIVKFKEELISDIILKLKNSDSNFNEYFAIKKEFSNILQNIQNNTNTVNTIKKEFSEISEKYKNMIDTYNSNYIQLIKTQEEKIKNITTKLNELQTSISNDINSLQNETKKNSNIINNISETNTSNNNDLQILKKSTSEKFQDLNEQINELNLSLTNLFKIEEV